MTFRRMYLADLGVKVWVVVSAVLPRTEATVVQVVPSVLSWTSKSRVSQPACSPPAPAWRSTTLPTVWLDCRSTRRNLFAPSAHHLSALPPVQLPLTALAGASV